MTVLASNGRHFVKMNWFLANAVHYAGCLNTAGWRNLVISQPLVIFIILVRIIYLSGKKIADKVGFASDFLV